MEGNNTSAGGHRACRLFIGTSGYSYREWVDAGFYPTGMQSSKMLPFYAREFSATELNFTWYQMPRADAMERLRSNAPPGFLFSAKLTRTLTHEVDPLEWRKQAEQYRNGIAPLAQSKQLGAILVQLPPTFDRSTGNRRYLAALLDELAGLPLAVEFRHCSWVNEKVYDELQRRQITLVSVDEPNLPGLFPALTVVTNPAFFYIRFHGRNIRGWRSGTMQKKFDYDYTATELGRWVEEKIDVMAGQARTGLLFFNNHVRGQAPKNARMLARMLQRDGFHVILTGKKG